MFTINQYSKYIGLEQPEAYASVAAEEEEQKP
jgi:hypothetical protein